MKIRIEQATIIDAHSKHHLKQQDIVIEKGQITQIAKQVKVTGRFKNIRANNLKVSTGWVDMHVNFCDPGFEYKEDLLSGANAAAAGGFTTVAVLPNTKPVIQSKSLIEYVSNKTQNHIVEVFPQGALSEQMNGKTPSEIYDMYHAGAIAFSDGLQPVKDTAALIRNLEYVKPFNGLVMTLPKEAAIAGTDGLNEGLISLKMGLKGQPVIAEEMAVQKEIKAVEYTNSRLHFIQVSTKAAVEHLKKAKQKNIHVSAAVSPYHLIFDESVMMNFDTNYKLNPPLRTRVDNQALINALKDGTIEVISCLHQPHETDAKKIEFEQAACGISGLQTVYPLLKTYLHQKINDELIVDKLSTQPRKLFGLPKASIEEGNMASLTLFNNDHWTFTKKINQSKSNNSPFLNQSFTGKVIGIINNNQLYLN